MNDDETRQQAQQEKLQSIVALGWVVLLVLFLAIVLLPLVQAAIIDDFTRFALHPTQQEWGGICTFIFAYALMPMLTRLFNRIWFRWLNVALLVFVTVFMARHQVQHMMEGVRYGFFGLIDVAHHVVGLLLVFLAIRWARI